MWGQNESRRGFVLVVGFTVALVCLCGAGFGSATETADSPHQEMDGDGTQENPYVVTNAEQLQTIDDDLGAYYVLGGDINASETGEWNNGLGFDPVGEKRTEFEGRLDGQNHTIQGLTVARPRSSNVGLFGVIGEDGVVENLALEAVNVTGFGPAGGLAGVSAGTIETVTVNGSVAATQTVAGGVVGQFADEPTVRRTVSDVAVSATRAGGIVGVGSENGAIRSSYSSGTVEGAAGVGGLIGGDASIVQNSYSVAFVDAPNREGGLVGQSLTGASISSSYWNPDDAGAESGIGYEQGAGASVQELRADQMSGPSATEHMSDLFSDAAFVPTDQYPVLSSHVQNVSVQIVDSPVPADQNTSVTVSLELLGGATVTASQTAEYEFDAAAVTVDGGLVQPQTTGSTEITVRVAGNSVTSPLVVRAPAEISVREATLETATVLSGTQAELGVVLANTGELSGTGSVTVHVGGDSVAEPTATIPSGSQESVTVTFEAPETGEYGVSAGDTDVGPLTVVEAGSVTLDSLDAPDRIPSVGNYNVTATFTNENNQSVTVPVFYTVGGLETERYVTVSPGPSTVVFEERAVETAGATIEHTLRFQGTEATASSDVRELPRIEVAAVDVPETIEAGESVTVTATIENTGSAAGEAEATISVGGEEVAADRLRLGSGESVEVSGSVSPDATGTVDFSVSVAEDSRSGTLDVEAADNRDDDTTDTADRDPTATATDGDDSADDGAGAGFGLTVALLAALGAALVAARRAREC